MEAGDITLEHFDDTGFDDADAKRDGSPVTIADRASESYIEKALKDVLPDVPFIGEEAYAEGRTPDITSTEYFWMVDALDGTKEFISGNGDYTVNIALIHNKEPVIGVIYCPVHGELYAGYGPGTAIRYMDDSETERSITVRQPPANGLSVVASRSHGDNGRMDQFLQSYKVSKLIKRGSSLKICVIAAGKADIYPRLGPTCEWDIAAGDAILRSAGGVLTDLQGQPIVYGKQDEKFLNPEFVACSQDLALAA